MSIQIFGSPDRDTDRWRQQLTEALTDKIRAVGAEVAADQRVKVVAQFKVLETGRQYQIRDVKTQIVRGGQIRHLEWELSVADDKGAPVVIARAKVGLLSPGFFEHIPPGENDWDGYLRVRQWFAGATEVATHGVPYYVARRPDGGVFLPASTFLGYPASLRSSRRVRPRSVRGHGDARSTWWNRSGVQPHLLTIALPAPVGRLRNRPGTTSLAELVRAAERQGGRTHAGAWEREFSGHPAVRLEINTLFPSGSSGGSLALRVSRRRRSLPTDVEVDFLTFAQNGNDLFRRTGPKQAGDFHAIADLRSVDLDDQVTFFYAGLLCRTIVFNFDDRQLVKLHAEQTAVALVARARSFSRESKWSRLAMP